MVSDLGSDEKKAIKLLQEKGNVSIGEATNLIASHLGIPIEKAAKVVYLLWKKGYLDLMDERALKGFSSYVFSWESLWYWILLGYIVLTSLTVVLISEPPLLYLRYVLGTAFVLYIPGAVLIEVLYPSSELEPLERFALSIGLSLAIVPLIGLILNYTPWGIRLGPILYSLVLFSLVMGFIAMIRKYKVIKAQLSI